MTPEMAALGRRAVACKGWRWLAGVPVTDDSNARGIVVELGPRWHDDPGWPPQNEGAIGEGLAVFRPGYGLVALHEWVPDLDDPAALGCLLSLVADAHGVCLDDVHVVRTTGRAWSVWIFRADDSSYRVARHEPSRAEALVAALEGAP